MTSTTERETTAAGAAAPINPRLDSKVPAGSMGDKWENYKEDAKLVNPNNKRKFRVLVVGSGQSGCQIAEELHEAGREVLL